MEDQKKKKKIYPINNNSKNKKYEWMICFCVINFDVELGQSINNLFKFK